MPRGPYHRSGWADRPGRHRSSHMSRPPSEVPGPRTPRAPDRRPGGSGGSGGSGDGRQPQQPSTPPWVRFLPWLLLLALVAVFVLPSISSGGGGAKDLNFTQFTNAVKNDKVKSVEFYPSNGDITGTFKSEQDGTKDF